MSEPSGEKIPKLLPGSTAYAISMHMGRWALVVTAGLILLPVLSLLPDADVRRLLITIDVAAICVLSPYVFLYLPRKKWKRVLEELEAGYTTMWDRGLDYWQLDPHTGEPVRRPGERQRFR
jgi:hypothetical protein